MLSFLRKKLVTDFSILPPISIIFFKSFPSLINLALPLKLLYAPAACLFIKDSGYIASCFLSVMGTVEHDAKKPQQLPVNN